MPNLINPTHLHHGRQLALGLLSSLAQALHRQLVLGQVDALLTKTKSRLGMSNKGPKMLGGAASLSLVGQVDALQVRQASMKLIKSHG